MAIYLGLAVALIGSLLQSTVLPEWTLFGVHLDLVLVAVAGWAALRRLGDGLTWALFGGVALDLFSVGPFGGSVLALAAAAFVAWLLGYRLRPYNQILVVAAVPFAAFAYYAVSAMLLTVGGATLQVVPLLVDVVGPALLFDTIAGPVVLFLLAWASHAITPTPWAAS